MKYSILLGLGLLSSATLTAQTQVMTPEKLWELGRVGIEDVSPDGKTVLYGVTRYNTAENKGSRDLYIVDYQGNTATQITNTPGSEYGAHYMMDGEKIGFTMGGQFHIMNADGSDVKAVTDVANAGGWKAYEMEDGNLALLHTQSVKMMETTGDMYPELDKADAMVIDDLMYRHWDHWNDAEVDHLSLTTVNMETGKAVTKDLMPEASFDVPTPPFTGSEAYVMSPDGKSIVYSAKKVTGKDWAVTTNTDLYVMDVETGEEVNFTVDNKGYDVSPSYDESGRYLAWLSMERDGYESDLNRLVVADLEKGTRVVLSGDEHILDYTWSDKRELMAVVAKEATQQIQKISFNKAAEGAKIKTEWLTEGDYNYSHPIAAKKGIVAMRSDMNHANEIFYVSKKKAMGISKVNDALYADVKMSTVEKRWVETTDGKKMLVWVILPPDFDATKKYPTLLYCQGGPQAAVSQFYSFRWNFQLMAANGYVVVAPNRRGLPGFGQDWNEEISGDWGGQSMRDYLSAIDDVAKEEFVDNENIGAVGASYGGYSVYMLAGIHEGRFSSFISHCGLFNLESWYLTTEEMFFANWDIGGPFWGENPPVGYEKFNPINYVGNWDTPILVIHGGLDFRVPINQGMEAFQAAQLKGIKSKFLYFPNEGHWVLNPQNGLIWHDQFFKWLDGTLK